MSIPNDPRPHPTTRGYDNNHIAIALVLGLMAVAGVWYVFGPASTAVTRSTPATAVPMGPTAPAPEPTGRP